jgi:hypothetical protein
VEFAVVKINFLIWMALGAGLMISSGSTSASDWNQCKAAYYEAESRCCTDVNIPQWYTCIAACRDAAFQANFCGSCGDQIPLIPHPHIRKRCGYEGPWIPNKNSIQNSNNSKIGIADPWEEWDLPGGSIKDGGGEPAGP